MARRNRNPKIQLRTLVHDDDFVTVRCRSAVTSFRTLLTGRFTAKTTVVVDGEGKEEVQDARIFNLIIRWTADGFEIEADQRHAELIVEPSQLGVWPGQARRACLAARVWRE